MAQPQRVFISYAREDGAWAQEMARILRGQRVDVYLDVDSNRAGENWPNRLRKEVERADQVRLGWSRDARDSEWVRREWAEALKKGQEGALLIDLLDDTPLPEELADIQAEPSPFRTHALFDRVCKPFSRGLPDPPNPSHLLRYEYGVVPFHGRMQEIGEALEWATSEDLFAARLYTGAGGTGKTRFAAQLCSELQRRGWDVGFLEDTSFDATAATSDELMRAHRRSRLIAIDQAETRGRQIDSLLRAGLKQRAGHGARLLMVARSEGDWWRELLESDFAFREAVHRQITSRPLGPLVAATEERQRVFQEAREAFAHALELAVDSVPAANLALPGFDRILLVHVAALLSVLADVVPEPAALLDEMLIHEQSHWRIDTAAGDRRWRQAVNSSAALITLLGGCDDDLDSVLALLASNPYLAELPLGHQERIARVFIEQYGHTGRVEPLQPDLLGEQLVARELQRASRLRTVWIRSADSGQLAHALTVLDRLAARKAKARDWLRLVLSEDIERLAEPAIEVALETGDPIGAVLAECLESDPRPEFASSIESRLPEHTVALRELAVEVTRQALDVVRGSAGVGRPGGTVEEARLLNNLGNRLSELGRLEPALAATEEAVHHYRVLAEARPDAFLPDLATSLSNLGISLSELGRREPALAATEEAVQHYRVLAEARPDAFLPNLAMSLTNLGKGLSELGRREPALAATEEAAQIQRVLADARPDTFLPDLAMSLNNLGIMLSELGRREPALAAAKEAVQIQRVLAEARPDAFLPDLAMSLNNLGIRLNELGLREPALAATEEAVQIQRVLAEARPDAFLPDLATSLTNLGISLSDLARREPALAAAKEAVHHYRLLAEARPDAFLPNLATSLNSLGNRLREMGRRETALAATEEAVQHYRVLAEARPDVFLPNLATSLTNLGISLSDLARREPALAATEEAVHHYRVLAEARPDAFLPDLAGSLNNLGIFLSELGRREPALAATEEAAQHYRVLAEARADAFLPNLAGSLNDLGIILSELSRREPALAAAEEAVNHYRLLAEARPDAFLPNLATSLNNLGIRLSELGRREPALAATEEAVHHYRVLAEARPDAFLPDLAGSLNNLGIRLSELGRRELALGVTEEAIRTVLFFAGRDPCEDLLSVALETFLSLHEELDMEPDQEFLDAIHRALYATKPNEEVSP